jgi:hypothetical protein
LERGGRGGLRKGLGGSGFANGTGGSGEGLGPSSGARGRGGIVLQGSRHAVLVRC